MTAGDVARMDVLRAEGRTWREVAEAMGVTHVTLYRWRKANGRMADADGLTLRQRRIVAEFDEPLGEIITGFRAMGYDWATIAGALEMSMRQLVEWRRKLGLPLAQVGRKPQGA